MKVLYVLRKANELSESYVRAEREWMESRGVETAIWAEKKALSVYPLGKTPCRIGGPLVEAIREFRPDLLHVHWMVMAPAAITAAMQTDTPVTVRGHSFDQRDDLVAFLDHAPIVKRVWLFPHFIADWMSEKFQPLPVAYSAERHATGGARKRSRVFRASAGLSGKSIEDYAVLAEKCPEFEFTLAVTRNVHAGDFAEETASRTSPNLTVRIDLQHEEVAELMRTCGVYIKSHDPKGHPYGMPISIAEAMGTGAFVLARNHPVAADYVGEAGRLYETIDEAAEIIRQTKTWTDAEWEKASIMSVERSKAFRADVILPAVLEDWERIRADRLTP